MALLNLDLTVVTLVTESWAAFESIGGGQTEATIYLGFFWCVFFLSWRVFPAAALGALLTLALTLVSCFLCSRVSRSFSALSWTNVAPVL